MPCCLDCAACCATAPLRAASVIGIESKNIRVEFDSLMHSRIVAKFDGKATPVGDFGPSEFVTTAASPIQDFKLSGHKQENVRDELGHGRRLSITGVSGGLQKTVVVTVYDEIPRMAFFQVHYLNQSDEALRVTGWTNNRYSITAAGSDEPAFWSYQSGSYRNRPDWVLPLKVNFKQENFLGMNATDYGGGTPVADVWRRDVGIAVGHLEHAPKLVSLPVTMPDATHATLALTFSTNTVLKPGETLDTFDSFVAVHQRDYFQSFQDYSAVMQRRGVKFNPAPESAFGPIWCAWGYGKTFTPSQVEQALPEVKKLGFAWVGVDDGWQTNEGDWALLPSKFPNGDRDMKALVDKIHAQGFRAQLWWAPLAAKPESDVVKNHPEELLLNEDGSKQKISYWNDWYFCPADPAAIEYHRQLVIKMFRDWGYDGLKLDGQHMNAVPPCYNPAHKHARPEDSVEALPKFFKMIYDTARSIKPDALVEFCPCGTSFNFFTLPEPEYERGLGSAQLLAGPHQGKDAQGAARRCHRLFRRSRRTERRAAGLCVHAGDRRRGRNAVHLASGFGAAKPPGSHAGQGRDLAEVGGPLQCANALPRRIPRRAVRHRLRPAGGSCHTKIRQDVLCVFCAAVEGPDRTARPRAGSVPGLRLRKQQGIRRRTRTHRRHRCGI